MKKKTIKNLLPYKALVKKFSYLKFVTKRIQINAILSNLVKRKKEEMNENTHTCTKFYLLTN